MSNFGRHFISGGDNVSVAHSKYRTVRAGLSIEHDELHRRAAAADGSVSAAEAEADCRLFLENIEAGVYDPEAYVSAYLASVLAGEVAMDRKLLAA